MRGPGLRRIAKPVFVVCLGLILYLIAANSGAGWLYVVAAAIGAVVIVSASLPWWNVRIEATRRARFRSRRASPSSVRSSYGTLNASPGTCWRWRTASPMAWGRAVAVRVGSREPRPSGTP